MSALVITVVRSLPGSRIIALLIISLGLVCSFSSGVTAQTLDVATLLGGNSFDRAQGIDVDQHGFIYLVFNTTSLNLPTTPNAFDRTHNGPPSGAEASDAYVAKLTPDGETLVWGTYLGGTKHDRGYTVKVNAAGAAYVSVWTRSPDFPTTPGAFDRTANGDMDLAIVKLSPDGSRLEWSTFVGGRAAEQARNALFVDDAGNVYVSGWTDSADFPTTRNAFQRQHQGGGSDAFVFRLKPDGSALIFSTLLGGSGDDEANKKIVVHSDRSIYVAGHTTSKNFPTSAGALQPVYAGDTGRRSIAMGDAFIARLGSGGSKLIYATYLGGSGDDTISFNDGMAVTQKGEAVVIGGTTSIDFPVTLNAFATAHNGGVFDGFVAKLSSDGSRLIASTYIGGNGDEHPSGVDVDASGRVYFSGCTRSLNYPVSARPLQPDLAGEKDGLLTILSTDLSAILYSTYFGGRKRDRGRELVLGASGDIFISGDTRSRNFPTTPKAFQQRHAFDGGSGDGFALRFSGLSVASDTIRPAPPKNAPRQ